MNGKSLRRHEGYLVIDHRESPGVDGALAQASGALPVGGNTLFEAATYTCSHCQRVVVVQPLRTRDRSYCRKCDHVICDECGRLYGLSGGECIPFKKVLDDAAEAAERGIGSPIIIT